MPKHFTFPWYVNAALSPLIAYDWLKDKLKRKPPPPRVTEYVALQDRLREVRMEGLDEAEDRILGEMDDLWLRMTTDEHLAVEKLPKGRSFPGWTS